MGYRVYKRASDISAYAFLFFACSFFGGVLMLAVWWFFKEPSTDMILNLLLNGIAAIILIPVVCLFETMADRYVCKRCSRTNLKIVKFRVYDFDRVSLRQWKLFRFWSIRTFKVVKCPDCGAAIYEFSGKQPIVSKETAGKESLPE